MNMKPQLEALSDLLAQLDLPGREVDEDSLYGQINALVGERTEAGETPAPELLAESMAFAFVEDYTDSPWGTYYGPLLILPNNQGVMTEFPSLGAVTADTLNYWKRRALEAHHPCLRGRYADLVWDFSKAAMGPSPEVEFARIAIDATLEMAAHGLYKYDVSIIKKLGRSLSLSLGINDQGRVIATRDAILAFEDRIGQDQLLGTWGFSFDLLLGNSKIALEAGQVDHIISMLEERLSRIKRQSTLGTGDIFAAEAAVLRLERHYASIHKKPDQERVLRTYATIVTRSSESLKPLLAHHWLQRAFVLLSSKGMKAEATSLTERIRLAGERTAQGLHAMSVEVSIPRENIEAYFDSFCVGSLEEALEKITVQFIPDQDRIAQQLNDLAQKAPLQSLLTQTIVDEHGRPLASIGSLDNDPDGHVVKLTSQNLQFEAMFLRGVIERVYAKYHPSPDNILSFLRRSPVYEFDKEPILRLGLSAYLNSDYVTAIHVLIPQIEAAIHTLAMIKKSNMYRVGKHGGFLFRPLDDILHDEAILTTLTQRITKYLSVLLTDSRGWNLRNDVCHGLISARQLGAPQADRVFHALLTLSFVRLKKATVDE